MSDSKVVREGVQDRRRLRVLQQIQHEVQSLAQNEWEVNRYLSGGSYGEVCGAIDKLTGKSVAIKRVWKTKVGHKEEEVEILDDPFLSKRVYREIKLLSHFHHDNILGLVTVLGQVSRESQRLEKVYMVMECMDTDLSQVIRDHRANITEQHIQYFMFQIFHGLKCLHDAGVIHRDLHPGNVLLNAENDIKICDFNLAKADTDGASTDYVTYRWYRAPELVMQWKQYDKKIDLWSVGCVMGELFTRKPLFPGTTFYNQLDAIIKVVGTPEQDEVSHIGSQSAKAYLKRELSNLKPKRWVDVIGLKPQADGTYSESGTLALDQSKGLLPKLLCFVPARRTDVDSALRHDYFKHPSSLFDEDEMMSPGHQPRLTFNESLKEPDKIREALWVEMQRIQERHRQERRAQAQEGVPEAADDEALPPLRAPRPPSDAKAVRTQSDRSPARLQTGSASSTPPGQSHNTLYT